MRSKSCIHVVPLCLMWIPIKADAIKQFTLHGRHCLFSIPCMADPDAQSRIIGKVLRHATMTVLLLEFFQTLKVFFPRSALSFCRARRHAECDVICSERRAQSALRAIDVWGKDPRGDISTYRRRWHGDDEEQKGLRGRSRGELPPTSRLPPMMTAKRVSLVYSLRPAKMRQQLWRGCMDRRPP